MGGAAPAERRGESAGLSSASVRSWMLLILLAAAFLRLYGLQRLSPPGLAHDEVANWLIDRSILAGEHAIYFTEAYGHEAGYHYLQAAFVALLGDHALALRLPSAFAGLLLVSVSFALARRMFGSRVALTSAALLGTLFWAVFYSRLGLRAITLPLASALSAYFWWRGWDLGQDVDAAGRSIQSPDRFFLLAGLFAGLSIHTYMAARALPVFYLLFVVYLALFHHNDVKKRWRQILLFVVVYAIIAAPLVLYLQTNPGSEFRITEIDAPLRSLTAGDIRPALENAVKIIAMFGFKGDPLWRQNIAGLPVFEPVIAVFFYLSLPLIMRRFGIRGHAFLMLWSMAAIAPSVVTIDAPSTIRIINILPVLTIFPALLIHSSGRLSTVIDRLSTKVGTRRMQLGLSILILYYIGLTSWALFAVWPQNDEVQFVWQAALSQAAAHLDASSDDGPIAVGGWTPETMDPPTLELVLRRTDLQISHFEPTSTLLIPSAKAGKMIRIIRPEILALDAMFVDQLEAWEAATQVMGDFVLYTMPAKPQIAPRFPADILFDGQLRFLGHDVRREEEFVMAIITYWEVTAVPDGPRRLFLHVLDEASNVQGEDYALDRSDDRFQAHWHAGDLILQHHTLDVAISESDRPISLRLGVFDPDSCPPEPCRSFQTADGEEFVRLIIDVSTISPSGG